MLKTASPGLRQLGRIGRLACFVGGLLLALEVGAAALVDLAKLETLKVGASTEQDVIAVMGTPQAVIPPAANHGTVFQYISLAPGSSASCGV